ncbi:rhophilin-1 isoform X3 [Octodon degus]|uniref:Rhophilin-1 isoform X3 n=1 Tax=Octodon degus TaxID=10160 RepID=A0A6P6F5Q1_OCTDE|nr:rhophilin-1 isoform X3 [Octodon degus]
MILEEKPDAEGEGEDSARLQAAGSVLKRCDPLAQTQHSWLQSQRTRIYQQIAKELRMRTGAENLYRATSNNQVRETVALELSYVNSNLQLLKEELEGLSSMADPEQPKGEGVTVPMIPLGLKETKELDWATSLKELISGHFGEDDATYETEIMELESLRQIGACQDRSCPEGAHRAAQAFQRAAGAFSLLRENFSHAPSPDMSTACLSTLEQLMAAQAQECIFEGLSLPAPATPHNCLAQEAAQVAAEYRLVHRAMAQPPVQDYVPPSWTTLVHVKTEHFHALAHYHAAMALCDSSSEDKLPTHEQAFQSPQSPESHGPPLPQQPEERRKLAKAHLKRAILGQEEALRLHALCRVLRTVDLLQAVVAQALQHSLAKYSELEREDDFFEAAEAPDIQPKTHQKLAVRPSSLSQMKVADIFHRLGPLSVFSTKNRWQLVGPVHMARGEGGFGFTLRGDSPVLIAAVVPGGPAAAAGLKEGDYIVSVNAQPCKWWKHAEVVAQLRAAGEGGVSLQVVSLLPSPEPRGTGDHRPGLLGPGGLLKSQRECGFETPAPMHASTLHLLGWSRKAKWCKTGGRLQPSAGGDSGTCP